MVIVIASKLLGDYVGFLGLGIMIGFIGVSLGFALWGGFECNL